MHFVNKEDLDINNCKNENLYKIFFVDNYIHPMSLGPKPSPSTLLLWVEEMPFELELSGLHKIN